LSTALGNPKTRTVHLLGYFSNSRLPGFQNWVLKCRLRGDRTAMRGFVLRLQSLGVDIHIEEVNALGRSMAGRPHFADEVVLLSA